MNPMINASYQFEGRPIHIFMDATRGTPWFCAMDVWAALGFSDTCEMGRFLKQHCKADGLAKYPHFDRLNRKNSLTFMDERNCYRLIDASRSPAAERFDQWLAKSVLPELRQTGQAKGHAHNRTYTFIKAAFCSQRWLVDSFGLDGQPIFVPLAPHTIVIKPEFLFDVLRKPDKVSLSLLPDIIRACVKRLEQAQPVPDQKEKAPSSF